MKALRHAWLGSGLPDVRDCSAPYDRFDADALPPAPADVASTPLGQWLKNAPNEPDADLGETYHEGTSEVVHCASSFGGFLSRFWIENELFYDLTSPAARVPWNRRNLSAELDAYITGLSRRA